MLKELQNGELIVRVDFKKNMNLQKMHYYPDIWAVESELDSTLCYGIADGMMAAIRPEGALAWALDNSEAVAQMLAPEVADEALQTYWIWKETRQ